MSHPVHVRTTIVALLLAALGLVGCGGGSSKGSSAKSAGAGVAGTAITIQNFAFSPPVLLAKTGDTITVTNKDDTEHTFTANDKSFDTGPFKGSKTIKMNKAGTFAYHCSIHTFMHGTIQVSG
jgi:plastocyanin